MDRFFTEELNHTFVPYSLQHVLSLIILLLSIILLFVIRIVFLNKKRNEKVIRIFRIALALILIITEGTLYYWYYRIGFWDVTSTLPLQLCSISLFLSIAMLLSKSYFLFEVVYFIGLGGAIQAFLTPELFYSFPHFRFFHFFVGHAGIILASLYMAIIEDYRPTLKSIGKTFIFLNIYAFIIFWTNKWLGANYLFLAEKPAQKSLLDLLGPYPWYILSLEAIALVTFFLLYLPFGIQKWLRRRVKS